MTSREEYRMKLVEVLGLSPSEAALFLRDDQITLYQQLSDKFGELKIVRGEGTETSTVMPNEENRCHRSRLGLEAEVDREDYSPTRIRELLNASVDPRFLQDSDHNPREMFGRYIIYNFHQSRGPSITMVVTDLAGQEQEYGRIFYSVSLKVSKK